MSNNRILVISAILCVLSLQAGCNEAQRIDQPEKSASEPQKHLESGEAKPEARPKINFEKTVHDLGELGVREKGD